MLSVKRMNLDQPKAGPVERDIELVDFFIDLTSSFFYLILEIFYVL